MIANPPLVLYGAGGNALSAIAQTKSLGYFPVCFCDNYTEMNNICDLPVLRWKEVNEKYHDDFLVYVTPNPPIKHEIIYDLLDKKVSKERIINYEGTEYRLGCNSLENCLLIRNKLYHYCCDLRYLRNAPPQIAMPTDTNKLVSVFSNYRDELIAAIQNPENDVPCRGCSELKKDYYPLERKVHSISFSPTYPCNLRCIYCDLCVTADNVTEEERVFLRTFDFAEFLNTFERCGAIGDNCPIEISGGEITINPRCEQILNAVKNYPVLLFSNCVIYNKKVQEIINKPDSFLLTSLDAGTRKSFAEIKGRDVFNTVKENILHYARNGGNIQLKYIIDYIRSSTAAQKRILV